MMKSGMNVENIAELTELSVAEIEQLSKTM